MNQIGRSDRDPSRDDALDRLLYGVSWPAPEPERVERLWRYWLRLPRTPTRHLGLGLAAAAALLLALTSGLLWRRHGEESRVSQSVPKPVEELSETVVPDTAESIPSRMPTSYEKVVVVAAAAQRKWMVDRSHELPAEQSPVDRAIERLIERSDADPIELANSLLTGGNLTRSELEDELCHLVGSQTGSEQLAAVRLLASVATRRSLPVLEHLCLMRELRSVAVPGVGRLVDPVVLSQLAAAESDGAVKANLLAELLRRGGHSAVAMFLSFVLDRTSFEVAMKAVDSIAEPPVEALFRMLDDSNYPLRIAAARVLGRIDGPVVSRRLANMVVRDINRREALIALLSCPSEDAAHFLAVAERNIGLASNIRAARFQLHTVQ